VLPHAGIDVAGVAAVPAVKQAPPNTLHAFAVEAVDANDSVNSDGDAETPAMTMCCTRGVTLAGPFASTDPADSNATKIKQTVNEIEWRFVITARSSTLRVRYRWPNGRLSHYSHTDFSRGAAQLSLN
jgi:hypothetical protein